MAFAGRLVVACLALAACSGSAVDADPPVEEVACADYAIVERPEGAYTNNVWNKQAAGEAAWRQCIIAEAAGDERMGWQWSWPENRRAVFGYPQIRTGTSPWTPDQAIGTTLPRRLDALEQLQVRHRLSGEATSEFNVATSLWLGDGLPPQKEAIRAEIMIWTYSTEGHFAPAGRRVDRIQAGGREWEVWLDEHWGDVSKANDNKWIYLVFRATDPALSADTDILSLLRSAESEGYIDRDWTVYDVELGMEVMGGTGTMFLDAFEVQVGP